MVTIGACSIEATQPILPSVTKDQAQLKSPIYLVLSFFTPTYRIYSRPEVGIRIKSLQAYPGPADPFLPLTYANELA